MIAISNRSNTLNNYWHWQHERRYLLFVLLLLISILFNASAAGPITAEDVVDGCCSGCDVNVFMKEALNAWRAKARCTVVPAERIQELFHELQFHPSERQISDMLQTAKVYTRKCNRQLNGLTFGEFCLLAADLKRFRTANFSNPAPLNSSSTTSTKIDYANLLQKEESTTNMSNHGKSSTSSSSTATATAKTLASELRSTKSLSNVDDYRSTTAASDKLPDTSPEVFLGGSCNPTTWRADVAIPALKKLGISFYNPQVSDWTPDLIELEYRAKEKARVLFFVMDSETRATAGAIEAAHIAGQNSKQLVLVLHPYKSNQSISNERISSQEFIDLTRNQQMLWELVTRRGLPVLDNIPLGLQRTKDILAGMTNPPSNVASILVVVRGAFDRVSPMNDFISIEQCQRALSYLGYTQNLLNIDSLSKIISCQRELLEMSSLSKRNNTKSLTSSTGSSGSSGRIAAKSSSTVAVADIDFELFCVLTAYLSVLQQEIHESGCVSPIKGTNVPPPPVYLANMQEEETLSTRFYSKHVFRTGSNTSILGWDDRQSLSFDAVSRDSGTSSPQPNDNSVKSKLMSVSSSSVNNGSVVTTNSTTTSGFEEESDSNDSVFSSSSSINSINNCSDPSIGFDLRDVYLGGSCALRTKWRQETAVPYFRTKGITFHMPALHESIQMPQHSASAEETLNFTLPSKTSSGSKDLHGESSPSNVTNNERSSLHPIRPNLFNPTLLDSSRVLLFVITNETRSLAPMTLAAHCIGLMYNVVLSVQMLPENCAINNEQLTPAAIKDYNRGRSYLIDLAKRHGVPVFDDLKPALECAADKVKACITRNINYS